MTTLNFPNSPTVGDTYHENGVTYQWDGTKWVANIQGSSALDGEYLKLDASNDPVTGNLSIGGNISLNVDGTSLFKGNPTFNASSPRILFAPTGATDINSHWLLILWKGRQKCCVADRINRQREVYAFNIL